MHNIMRKYTNCPPVQSRSTRCLRRGFTVLMTGLLLWAGVGASAVELVRDGRPVSAIVLPAEPLAKETLAAEELVEHVKVMSGAVVPVLAAEAVPEGLLPVFLGRAAEAGLDAASLAAGKNPSTFTVRVRPERVDIRGLSDEGTLFGVYELLEQVGFRWYMPGEFGRVVPEGRTVTVQEQMETQAPSIIWRKLQHLDNGVPWARRARLGGEERSTGRHGIPGLGRNAFAEHPEWYSYDASRGERRPRQDCLSNPEVLQRAIEGVRQEAAEQGGEAQYVGAASHDGGGYCECEKCKALDQGVYDPTADRESMSDRYIWFFNQILEALEEEFPNLHIVHYTYGAHMMPPVIEMNPRIVPVFAPITIDRLRGMDNPMSPDRHLLRWLIDEYTERGVREMYYRGYYHNLACPQFPLSQLDQIENETRVFVEKGITVMRVENIHTSWSSAFLDLYLAARMMWNAETDVAALLDEFYRLYYGPAEAPMRAYHEGLESAFRDTPYFAGSSYPYLPIFLGHPRRDTLRGDLDAAAKAAVESPYAERIAAVRLNWDRLDAFLDLMDARNRHDFAAAHARMEEFYRLSDEGALMEPLETGPGRGYTLPRLIFYRERSGNNGSYFNRFFRGPVVSGYARTVTEGDLVAPLADEWDFLLDPAEIGEIGGWQRPGELGGNWSPLKTSSRSWSAQGLHYYKGVAWYRQTVRIPEKYKGRPIYLWFGGVDELAKVWVNGTLLGTNREPLMGLPGVPGTFRPFDLLATDAVRLGEDNTVSVKITNKRLNEIGTGGIVGPVMFWSPHDPDWKP